MNIPLNSAFRNLGQEGVLLTPMASFMWAWPDGIPTNAPFGGVMYGPQTTVPLKLPFTEYCSDNDVGQKKARVWWALRRTRRRRSLPWILHFLAFRDSDADDDAGPGVEEVQAAVERADAAGAPAAGKAFLRCPLSDLALLVAYAARNSLPVASWLARHGIQTLVLRYRLLPHYDHQDALSDLEAAVQLVRKHKDGPVAAIGFSAGGHLVASLSLRLKKTPLDAQVLVYPAIDGSDWAKPGSAGFWDPACNKNTDKLLEGQQALLGGLEDVSTLDTANLGLQDVVLQHRPALLWAPPGMRFAPPRPTLILMWQPCGRGASRTNTCGATWENTALDWTSAGATRVPPGCSNAALARRSRSAHGQAAVSCNPCQQDFEAETGC
eukprot:s2021_g9.t2